MGSCYLREQAPDLIPSAVKYTPASGFMTILFQNFIIAMGFFDFEKSVLINPHNLMGVVYHMYQFRRPVF